MFNALAGKRFDDMIGLLKLGHSIEKVAAWLEVRVDYVKEHADALNPQPPIHMPKPFVDAVLPVEPIVRPKPPTKKKGR